MEGRTVSRREIGVGNSKGLSLGWLLALAIGGGVLILLSLGLLLIWYFRQRNRPCNTRVYSWGDMPSQTATNGNPAVPPGSAKRRLMKKRTGNSSVTEVDGSAWSSRMSLTLPVLPPMGPEPVEITPRGRKRSRSLLNEQEARRQSATRKSWRDSWSLVAGWFGKNPAVSDLHALEDGTVTSEQHQEQTVSASAPCTPQRRQGPGSESPIQQIQRLEHEQTPTKKQSLRQPSEGRIEVKKRDARAQQQQQQQQARGHQNQPRVTFQQNQPGRGHVRRPSQAHVKPTAGGTELNDILSMTEQRLQSGTSSPGKNTPRTSPAKRSPVKTPRTYRSVSRNSPSPAKRTSSGPQGMDTYTESRNASATSVCSAADSLLAAAAQELVLPGGASSPSKLRGREWTASEQPQTIERPANAQLRYRKSMDSDVSSSLSTLYSAGEPEEHQEHQNQGLALRNAGGFDPFVESPDRRSSSWEAKKLAEDPRAFKRRTQAMNAAEPASSPVHSSACPSPLRPVSMLNKSGGNENIVSSPAKSIVLEPPMPQRYESVEPKAASEMDMGEGRARQISESSMESVSVHTDDSEEQELPVLESSARKTRGDFKTEGDDSSASSRTSSPSTPVRKRRTAVDMSSSPYSEEDILSLLLDSAGPKRALPLPPPRVEGADDLGPTQLSPRPRSKPRLCSRLVSGESEASSNYDQFSIAAEDEDTFNPIIIEPSTQTPNLTHTISELRRMNSMISNYSAASTALGEFDSPVLPHLRGGVFPSTATQSRGSMGKKSYLSIGDYSPKKKTVGHQRTNSKKSLKGKSEEEDTSGKENETRGPKPVRNGSQSGSPAVSGALRESRRTSGVRTPVRSAAALARENSARGSPTPRTRDRKRLNPVEQLAASEKKSPRRQSIDSLGLYDKDGFLVGTPERERCLRM
ncbi:hypothetical protein LIA77_02230 [Sarocladium implicatum]|nr:hypothetical protein LIA77_02230 [Sarocladium implicatum]